jgi:hypothetical protein
MINDRICHVTLTPPDSYTLTVNLFKGDNVYNSIYDKISGSYKKYEFLL